MHARGTCDAEQHAMTTRSISLAILLTACTATRSFEGLGGSGPNDIWLVGASTPAESASSMPIAFHWDGSSWSSREDVPAGGLSGVWCSSPNDVWFAGESTLRWNGEWTNLGDLEYTRAVWGDGAGATWAVGLGGRTIQFDASGMRTTPTTPTSEPLFGVWGSAAFDVWAVGLKGTVLHWQGTSWTASSIPVTTSSLNAIAGNASNDVWAVGDSGTIAHWDGATWTSMPSGTMASLEGVWANGADDIWAVGGHDIGHTFGVVLHYDGSAWSEKYRGDSQLNTIWGTSNADVWAAGSDLAVVHWNGTEWTSTELSPP